MLKDGSGRYMTKIEQLQEQIKDLERQIRAIQGDVDSNLRRIDFLDTRFTRIKENLRIMIRKIANKWGVPDYQVGDIE